VSHTCEGGKISNAPFWILKHHFSILKKNLPPVSTAEPTIKKKLYFFSLFIWWNQKQF
jgi:hypothetical protein